MKSKKIEIKDIIDKNNVLCYGNKIQLNSVIKETLNFFNKEENVLDRNVYIIDGYYNDNKPLYLKNKNLTSLLEQDEILKFFTKINLEISKRLQYFQDNSIRNYNEYLLSCKKIIFPKITIIINNISNLYKSDIITILFDFIVKNGNCLNFLGINLIYLDCNIESYMKADLKVIILNRLSFKTLTQNESKYILDNFDAYYLESDNEFIYRNYLNIYKGYIK